jgi:putative oxidoreductase
MLSTSSSSPLPIAAQWAVVPLRFALGAMYIAHALYKILVLTWPGVLKLFAAIGLPGWMAYPMVAAELIGGACLILGLHARWAALLLMPTLMGAIAFVHGSLGWIFTSPGGGWEYLAVLICVSIAVACLGNGALSIEKCLPKRDTLRSHLQAAGKS